MHFTANDVDECKVTLLSLKKQSLSLHFMYQMGISRACVKKNNYNYWTKMWFSAISFSIVFTEATCTFMCKRVWFSLFLALLLPTYLKYCLRKGVNNVQWRQGKKDCQDIHRLYAMKIFLAVMIVKRGSWLPKEITSLDVFKKRVKNVCQNKFRYCWSCFRVEGGTKWPLEDPSRPIFFDSLSIFLRLLNIHCHCSYFLSLTYFLNVKIKLSSGPN